MLQDALLHLGRRKKKQLSPGRDTASAFVTNVTQATDMPLSPQSPGFSAESRASPVSVLAAASHSAKGMKGWPRCTYP